MLAGPQAGRDLHVTLPIPFPLMKLSSGFSGKTLAPPHPSSPIVLSLMGKGTVPIAPTPCSHRREGFRTEA